MCKSLKEQDPNAEPSRRFLTASLHVDYLKPTPLNVERETRAKVKELKGRKVIVEEWLMANGVITVRVPEFMLEELMGGKVE